MCLAIVDALLRGDHDQTHINVDRSQGSRSLKRGQVLEAVVAVAESDIPLSIRLLLEVDTVKCRLGGMYLTLALPIVLGEGEVESWQGRT